MAFLHRCRSLRFLGGAAICLYFPVVVALHFPYDVGLVELPPVGEEIEASSYYDEIYAAKANAAEHDYVGINRSAQRGARVDTKLAEFVEAYGLRDARTLEVGAGSGALQDVVEDYTGLDIAASAARYFHKPFVEGSATSLPFEDDAFGSVWTVWTLEHVPDPEKAMRELRRVVEPGGMLFFYPAYNCPSWSAKGYLFRRFASLPLPEKLVRLTLLVRDTEWFIQSYRVPTRLLRYGYWQMSGEPTRLRYRALAPNYTNYWTPDADATASLDVVEAMIWFESRGDECLNCPDTLWGIATMGHQPLHIRIGAKARATAGSR